MLGELLHPEYGKEILQKEIWAQGIPKDAFLGVSAIPDSTDCENLYSAIESGELTRDYFGTFCSAHELPDNLQSEESAKFLEYMWGRCLAWIHMPDDAESTLLPLIAKELAKRGHFVIDPESGMVVG